MYKIYYWANDTEGNSGEGILVSDFSAEKRIFVPYDSIPKTVINAFLSAEDKNFFKHPGVDAKGVIRAFKNNVFNLLNDDMSINNILQSRIAKF